METALPFQTSAGSWLLFGHWRALSSSVSWLVSSLCRWQVYQLVWTTNYTEQMQVLHVIFFIRIQRNLIFKLVMLPYFVKVRLSLITGGRVRGFFVSHWNITDPLSPCSILMISPHWQLIFYYAPPFPPPLYSVSDPICSPRKPCDPPKNRPTHRPTPPSTSFGIIIMLFVCFRSLLSTVLQNTIWDWEGTLDLTKVRDLYQL